MAYNPYNPDLYGGNQQKTGGPYINGQRGSGTAASVANAAIQSNTKSPQSFGSLSQQWANAIPQRNILTAYMQPGGAGPQMRGRGGAMSQPQNGFNWNSYTPDNLPFTQLGEDFGGGDFGPPRGGPGGPGGPGGGGPGGGTPWRGAGPSTQPPFSPVSGAPFRDPWEGAPAPPGSTTVIPSTLGRPGGMPPPSYMEPPVQTYAPPAGDPSRYYTATPFEMFNPDGTPKAPLSGRGAPGGINPGGGAPEGRFRPFPQPVGLEPPTVTITPPSPFANPTPDNLPDTQLRRVRQGTGGYALMDQPTPTRGAGPSTQPVPAFPGGAPSGDPWEAAPAPPGSTTVIPSTLGRPIDMGQDWRFSRGGGSLGSGSPAAPMPGDPNYTPPGGIPGGSVLTHRGSSQREAERRAATPAAPIVPSTGTATPPPTPGAATPSIPGFNAADLPNVNLDWFDPIKRNALDDAQKRALHLGSLSGAVNSGGFIPGVTEELGKVGAQYDAQKGGMMFQAQQAAADRILDQYKFDNAQDLQKWAKEHEFELQRYGIDQNVLLGRFQAEQQARAAGYAADASSSAARYAADASMQNSWLDFMQGMYGIDANYGLGQDRLGFDYYNAGNQNALGWGNLGFSYWDSGQNRAMQDQFNRRNYDLGFYGINRDVYGMDQAQQRYLMDLLWRQSPGGMLSTPGFQLPGQFPY